ncbi:MAG: hypothetical protein FWG82_01615 [Oscillospiraceae bacterium]|nr:hypothetical protein [Oscillospiraceae bacterium]
MVKLILGSKGHGKTKKLIELVNAAATNTKGFVVCVDKSGKLGINISNTVRLSATDEYDVYGYAAFYGFLAGICAGNYDITDVFVDATLRIGTRDMDKLSAFLDAIEKLSRFSETDFTFTVSEDKENLPDSVLKYCA